MSRICVEIEVEPQVALERLVDLPGAFFLRDEQRTFWGAFPCEESSSVDPTAGWSVPAPEAAAPRAKSASAEAGDIAVPEWIGCLPYEAFRGAERGGGCASDERPEPHWTRPRWRRYEAVACLLAGKLVICGANQAAVERLADALRGGSAASEGATAGAEPAGDSPRLTWRTAPEDGDVHRKRVRAALAAITRGEMYQVNLARRFEFQAQGHPLLLLQGLGALAAAPFAAAFDFGDCSVVSSSPELFLDVSASGRVLTRPIKGTRPRSGHEALDRVAALELETSEKERAELAMVIDIERNDLGRLAETGSVRMLTPPHVVEYPTIFHREAEVVAQLRQGVTRQELLMATMPSGSITGAPKVSAMDWIARLEAHRRGLYTGALGYIADDGSMRLSMAIRVLSIRDGVAHYYSGGGIVADSDPDQELEETLWKAAQLRDLIDVLSPT